MSCLSLVIALLEYISFAYAANCKMTNNHINLQWQKPDEDYGNYTKEVDNATCQYDFMMRALQPDVPCPNNLTILNLWENHNHLMSAPVQDEMCSEMGYPTEMKSAMVRSCAFVPQAIY